MDKVKFNAIIEQHQGMDASYVKFPFEVQKVFGTKGRVKVKAIFEGKAEYRGSLVNMGLGNHILILTKEIRSKISKSFGDTISVEIEKDTEERVITLPDYIFELLGKHPKAKEFYNGLSYTNQKEYIRWIESAKKEETKTSRIELFIEKLNSKKKFSDK